VLLALFAPRTLVFQPLSAILKIVRAILRADAPGAIRPGVGPVVEGDGEHRMQLIAPEVHETVSNGDGGGEKRRERRASHARATGTRVKHRDSWSAVA